MTINKKFVIIISASLLAVVLVVWLFLRFNGRAKDGADQTRQNGVSIERQRELESLDKNLATLRSADKDLDGLSDKEEDRLGTNPEKVDTDNDGLLDGDEIKIYQSDPLRADTDSDGFKDGIEVRRGFSPTSTGKL